MRINNNVMAINTHRQYGINNANISKSVEKLSSGYRVNRAGDDAAGLAISEKMRAQIRGLTMASKNSQDAISLVQTAEGALQESHNILQRMRELAVQSASDTNETSVDRDALNKEFKQLIAELDDTAAKTKFNDMGLIDGSYAMNVTTAAKKGNGGEVYGSVWAASNVSAGTYNVVTSSVVVQAKVAAKPASIKVSSEIKLNASNTTSVSISFEGSTTSSTDTINGKWTFGFSNGMFTATNLNTGEVKTASAGAITGTVGSTDGSNSIKISFGDLGTLTITNNGNTVVQADQFEGISGAVTAWNGVSGKEEVVKHYASINGDSVELVDGMNTIVFKNIGISINLTGAYKSGSDDIESDLDKVKGTILVEKGGVRDFTVQTGANQGDELKISIEKMDAYSLGVKTAKVSNRLDASAAITQVNRAVNLISSQRASLGALQNRLNHKIANLDTSAENLQSAESRIRDVDMAKEMTTFMKNNILSQASTAMLAQANSMPQGVLQLLG